MASSFYNRKPYMTKFVSLDYPDVKIEENGSVARFSSSVPRSGPECSRIVYLNRPLTNGVTFVFTSKNVGRSSKPQDATWSVGLTTCGPDKLSKYFYHQSQPCGDGKSACGGYSAHEEIYSDTSTIKKIVLHREESDFAFIETYYADGSHTYDFLQEEDDGRRMADRVLYPFLMISFKEVDLAVHVRAEVSRDFVPAARPINVNRVEVIPTAYSWYVSRGIGRDNSHIIRRSEGPHYAVFSQTLAPGQVYNFDFDKLDHSVVGETFTFGLTTADMTTVELDSLPPLPHHQRKGWTIFNNVLPSMRRGHRDRVQINVLSTGLVLETPLEDMCITSTSPPKEARLFFYMTSNIKRAKITVCGLERKATNTGKNRGDCIVCLEERSNYLITPCNHLSLCDTCAPQVDRSDGCPVCRTKIKSIVKVFVM